MPNDIFKPILEALKTKVTELAIATFKDYKEAAKTDALSLLDQLKHNLENWTIQLASGELSKADFEFLVLAQKELIEMNALKQAGLAMIKADEFKAGLLDIITSTVFSLIKI